MDVLKEDVGAGYEWENVKSFTRGYGKSAVAIPGGKAGILSRSHQE